MSTIEIRNVNKSFAEVEAVRDVSFSIEKGVLCGLLGPNGAGKSTLFKMMMGLLEPDSGQITLADKVVTFGEVEYKRKIGYAPESAILYEYLTGMEFLAFIAAAKKIPKGMRQEQIDHWLFFLIFPPKPAGLFSTIRTACGAS